jgi:hypothetical protein
MTTKNVIELIEQKNTLNRLITFWGLSSISNSYKIVSCLLDARNAIEKQIEHNQHLIEKTLVCV